MTDASYRVIPRGAAGFDVEIGKPDGRCKTVPGFHSEHEANAWIIQAMRLVRDAGPWTPLVPRKPTAKPTGAVQQPAASAAPAGPRLVPETDGTPISRRARGKASASTR